jgi:hypothetical protein
MVANGDLVQVGNQFNLVFGVDKLNQDINLWIMERFGGDRFHTNMGSILQDFIGGIVNDSTRAEVQAECFRVLQNYQALQMRMIKTQPTWLSTSEMLVSVDSVTASVSYDTVNVVMQLRNGSGTTATIALSTGLQ